MDIKEYIASGILELYVAGALSEKENEEVNAMILQYPEVKEEVIKIESSIISLTAAASPSSSKNFLPLLVSKINRSQDHEKVVSLQTSRRSSWITYSGWAAAVVVGVALFWTVNEIEILEEQMQVVETNNDFLEEQIEKANSNFTEAQKLLSVLRDRDIISVPLAGQEVYPEAYAKVYWNKNGNNIYLDAQGLPQPPRGKVYQVWSLKMSPLTPTSLGTLDKFEEDDNKIFSIPNPNESEAFGITLEPAGGSETPTMDQLYTIGLVESAS